MNVYILKCDLVLWNNIKVINTYPKLVPLARGTKLEKCTIEGHNVFVERVLLQKVELSPEILFLILQYNNRE